MEQKTVTVETIAQYCGVSCGTVSRALTRPEMVAPKTREKILAAVKKYNYIPNPVARAMSGKRGKTISMVVPDIQFAFQGELIRGCTEELYKHGYTLLVLDNSIYHQRITDYIEVLKQQICNGVIFCFENDEHSMQAIMSTQPIVSYELDASSSGICSVVLDLDYAFEVLVDYLYRLNGHTKIGLVAGRAGDNVTARTVSGYRKSLERAGIKVREEYISYCGWSMQQGYEAFNYLSSLDDPPTVIVFYCCSLAQGGLAACCEQGLHIPKDISIVTMDGSRYNRYLPPNLTTLDYDAEEIGATLANQMINCLNRQSSPQQYRTIRPGGVCTGASVKKLDARQ